jgi:hypothetical protein
LKLAIAYFLTKNPAFHTQAQILQTIARSADNGWCAYINNAIGDTRNNRTEIVITLRTEAKTICSDCLEKGS